MTVILIPAIDLKDGQVLRFVRGLNDATHAVDISPVAQALEYVEHGFEYLHIVDLNGATSGQMANAKAIEDIAKALKIPFQVGGGIRSLSDIEFWLERGASRVVLGTIAQTDPHLIRQACQKFQGRICVSIDAKGGYVALSGWTKITSIKALELALRYEDAGVAAIIYTDIGRDGTTAGINIEMASDLAFALTTPLIAAGGLATLDDIIDLQKEKNSGIIGVIGGQALCDGRIDPKKALAAAGEQKTTVF